MQVRILYAPEVMIHYFDLSFTEPGEFDYLSIGKEAFV